MAESTINRVKQTNKTILFEEFRSDRTAPSLYNLIQEGHIKTSDLEDLEVHSFKEFLDKLIGILKVNRKPISDVLKINELKLLEDIRLYCKDDIEVSSKLKTLDALNKEIIFKNNSIVVTDFVVEYVSYIKQNGKIPEITSLDDTERVIASKLEVISTVIDSDDYQKIVKMGKKAIEDVSKVSLYDKLINFLNTNQRAPSILSDDMDERELAEEYQKGGSKLSAEQKKQVNLLMKKYQLNTVMYFKKKKGV